MSFLPSGRINGDVGTNPFSDLMSSLFCDDETADVLLEVGDGEKKRQFYAHHLVLKKCAPHLANMCEGCDTSKPLHLPDIEPDIFCEVLRYVYGGAVTYELWKNHHRDFIDAADKYGVVGLKLEAETRFVDDTKLTVGTVVDVLAYADSKNCALMKEFAIAFVTEHIDEVFNSPSIKNFPKSEDVIKEVFKVGFLALAIEKNKGGSRKMIIGRQVSPEFTIRELRRKLSQKGLEIDGSREVLLARLEGNTK